MNHKVEQKSSEWFELRLKYPMTASNAQAIGKCGKGLNTLIETKLSEKYSTAERIEIDNEDLKRGNEFEEYARQSYELISGNEVEEIGFITNENFELSGASPDGLIKGKNGGIEIKCQNDRKHFLSICEGVKVESKYQWQVQMQMLICKLDFVDFVLYNPNFSKSTLIKRILPDEKKQDKLKEGIKKGIEYYNKLNKKYNE